MHSKRRRARLAIPACMAAILSFAPSEARTGDSPATPDEKHVSGMSIVGNDEAPKSLVIVPWKSSDLGDSLDVSRMAANGRDPVDREVFARELGR